KIPKYTFYEVYTEDIPIFLNFLIFFLLIATIDKAFRDYSSISEILDTINIYKKVGYLKDKILKIILKVILGERIPLTSKLPRNCYPIKVYLKSPRNRPLPFKDY
ncbi:Zinc finger C2H2, partial [Penicillium freii]